MIHIAGQICETCAKIHDRCYCAPNSTCEHYTPFPKLELTWNVYRHDFNTGEIKKFNIFDHWKFNEDVQTDLRKCYSRTNFSERLKKNLMYYFGHKCEYEIIVSSWPYTDKAAIKIDIYQQTMLNFNRLLEYIWQYKEIELK